MHQNRISDVNPTGVHNKTRSKSNITPKKKKRPSNETIFFRHLLPGEENRRMLLERTYFSKSRLLYIPREVRYITSRPFVTGGRAARGPAVFRNDKRKLERAACCHGLSGRSFGCTENTTG